MNESTTMHPLNARVVSMNMAYGYFAHSKPCAGTVIAHSTDGESVVVKWDDGDECLEMVGDTVRIGVNAGDKMFGQWAPSVAIVEASDGSS